MFSIMDLGWWKAIGFFVYDNVSNAIIQQEGKLQEGDLEEGKAYIQKLYWDFNSRWGDFSQRLNRMKNK